MPEGEGGDETAKGAKTAAEGGAGIGGLRADSGDYLAHGGLPAMGGSLDHPLGVRNGLRADFLAVSLDRRANLGSASNRRGAFTFGYACRGVRRSGRMQE